jgi:hypothetical protein
MQCLPPKLNVQRCSSVCTDSFMLQNGVGLDQRSCKEQCWSWGNWALNEQSENYSGLFLTSSICWCEVTMHKVPTENVLVSLHRIQKPAHSNDHWLSLTLCDNSSLHKFNWPFCTICTMNLAPLKRTWDVCVHSKHLDLCCSIHQDFHSPMWSNLDSFTSVLFWIFLSLWSSVVCNGGSNYNSTNWWYDQAVQGGEPGWGGLRPFEAADILVSEKLIKVT